jgi:taurine dioxygenase
LPEAESEDLLGYLFEHQLQPKFRYLHRWTEGDVLMWDDLVTLHNAQADYSADEPRLIKRCQVMADRIFDPTFLKQALAERVEA